MKFTRAPRRLAVTIGAVGVAASVLAGCGSSPASVDTTPLTMSGVQTSASATTTPSTSADGTATGAVQSATTTAAAPTSSAPTSDDGTSEEQALAKCLRSKGIPLDVNDQPDPSNPSFNADAAQKAFTTCSLSIIAGKSSSS